jgi:hypothetical protein
MFDDYAFFSPRPTTFPTEIAAIDNGWPKEVLVSRQRKCLGTMLIVALGFLAGLVGCDKGSSRSTSDRHVEQSHDTAAGDKEPVAKPSGVDMMSTEDPQAIEQRQKPQRKFRPDDSRPHHDDSQLEAAGIHVYESKRLKLYTDLDAKHAESLPALIDQVYADWEAELGPMPPNRAGTDFQITGYLIRDMALFREFQLILEDVPLVHGRHLRNRFWMRDQTYDYYRRHLLIHEATHCFMTFMPGVNVPLWYLEGMAEYFATHQLNKESRATFRVVPDSDQNFPGFGRIAMIRGDVAEHHFRTIPSLFAFQPDDFRQTNCYAWSWALCLFLDRHPRYHERFQKLSRITREDEFVRQFHEMYHNDERDIATEWTLFSAHLQYGYDLVRSAIDFHPGTNLADKNQEPTAMIVADRGWQSSEALLEAGQTYEITATGQFTLAETPKPWLSEPQGITFRYFDGLPLGTLLGCLRTEDGPTGGEDESMLRTTTIGRGCVIKPEKSGTLYLRLNDAWNSLHDNRGQVSVVIRRIVNP